MVTTLIDEIIQKLARHPKRIVFPEGEDPRILTAASEWVRLKLGTPVLIGNRDRIGQMAAALGVGLVRIRVVDPVESEDFETFCRYLARLPKFRDVSPDEARKVVATPNYFAAMMLQYGQVDGLVGGASTASGSLLRPLFSLVKPLSGISSVSSCMVMQLKDKGIGSNGILFFADCGVIPEPTVEQLAHIAVETARTALQLTGMKPKVAMLSFSTKGSARTHATEKVVAATALARKLALDNGLEASIDGELQVDAALVSEIAESKSVGGDVAGHANVLIFPDLNSGNIATKLVRHLSHADAYGQLLVGLSKPAADISRGASVEDIIGVSALVGVQAITYRELYPEQGVPPHQP
jgi:phosphate acetyltransferase